MFIKVVVGIAATLAYVSPLTIIFEYCLNEASSTLLTTVGILLFTLFTSLYIALLYRVIKRKRSKYPMQYD